MSQAQDQDDQEDQRKYIAQGCLTAKIKILDALIKVMESVQMCPEKKK